MTSILSAIIVLVVISAIFSIPFVYAKHNSRIDVLKEIQDFNRLSPSRQHEYLIKKYLTMNEIKRLMRDGWKIAFKGFNSNMTCMNDFEYREGKTYTCKGEPVLCVNGFHACLLPKDVANYYDGIGKKYHIVFLKGVTGYDRCRDSKVCAKTIKIGPRIDYRYITGYDI